MGRTQRSARGCSSCIHRLVSFPAVLVFMCTLQTCTTAEIASEPQIFHSAPPRRRRSHKYLVNVQLVLVSLQFSLCLQSYPNRNVISTYVISLVVDCQPWLVNLSLRSASLDAVQLSRQSPTNTSILYTGAC